MWQWIPNPSSDELYHSSKGTTWSKHKYIRKEGDRYIYPEDISKKKAGTAEEIFKNAPDKEYQQKRIERKSAEQDANAHESLADFEDKMRNELLGYKNTGYYSSETQRGLAAGAKRRAKKLKKEEDELDAQRDEARKKALKADADRKKRKAEVDLYRKNPLEADLHPTFPKWKKGKGKSGHF